MGALVKLIDAIIFIFLSVVAFSAPLIDSQTILPGSLYPKILVDLKSWYAREYHDFLVAEKPHFFVGLVWLQFLFQWPLALLNLYAILGSKCWFNTSCLIYGVSVLTSMVAILGEMIGSGKASDKVLMLYWPFFALGVLMMLRGLLLQSGKSTASTVGKGPALGRKKRA